MLKSGYILTALVILCLAGCGGEVENISNAATSGGTLNPNTVLGGNFRDSDVSGLSYISGQESGVTSTQGNYNFELGGAVTFSVGGVVLGSATGDVVITPLDFVASDSSSNNEVLNIVRFLMLLDNDGNPGNGITISDAVQNLAKNWAQIDFTTTDLESALGTVTADLATVTGETHVLPDAATAQAELDATLLCSHSGAFGGSFVGTDNGNYGVYVDPITGDALGYALGTVNTALLELNTPLAALNFDTTSTPVVNTGTADGLNAFNFSYTDYNDISGGWTEPSGTNGADSGTLTATRIDTTDGGALYRFSGSYQGSSYGVFSFGVSVASATEIDIEGAVYEVGSNSTAILSGQVVADYPFTPPTPTTPIIVPFNASSSDNTLYFEGTLNFTTGAMTGNWYASLPTSIPQPPIAGTLTGNGCALN